MKHLLAIIISIHLVIANSVFPSYAAGISSDIDFYIENAKDARFVVDDKPAVNVEITIPSDNTDKFEMRLIADYNITETVPIYSNNGETQEFTFEFAVTDEGIHNLRAELVRNGSVYHNFEFEQYYIKSVSNDAYTERGFCMHYDQSKGSSLDTEMIKAGGTPVLRDGITWTSVEKEKGVYDFSKNDAFIAELTENGIELLCVIDSYAKSHPLYPDENGNTLMHTEEQINAFANFVLAAVERYPQIRKWEILNEPNFVMTGEEYFNIVYTVAKRMKEYDPTLEVYAGGLAIYDTENFVNGFYVEKLYPYVDGISYHHYNHWRYADGPEYYDFTDRLINIMMREGGWKNLIITETGYSTGIYSEQVPEIKQASDNVKRAVVCDWYGIDFLNYYDFKDDGYDETEREHNFGSIKIDNTPKSGYYTVKQYQKATNRSKYVGEVYLSDDITSHLYAANDDYMIIAWAKNENPGMDIRDENLNTAEYTFEGMNVRIENMFGEYIPGNTLIADYQPYYIHGLDKEFCISALNAMETDIFANVRNITGEFGYSTERIEGLYSTLFTNTYSEHISNYVNACFDMAEDLVNDYLYGGLDMSEAAFSNLLSEIVRVADFGARIAVLCSDNLVSDFTLAGKYDALSVVPSQAVEKEVAYINEPYYKGRAILDKIEKFDEGKRVKPQKGDGFELTSDNKIFVSGNATVQNVLFSICNSEGDEVYVNILPTDAKGNYYMKYIPDMPHGEYTVTINNGEILTSDITYVEISGYISMEDKVVGISHLQANRLLKLYQTLLDWAGVKYSYYNPEIESLVWNETQWINITGKISRMAWTEYSDVILTATDADSGNLVYIDSTYPDENGEYRFSFKYEGDASKLIVRVDQGGVSVDNETINVATKDKLITGRLELTDYTNTTEVMLEIENYFKLTDKKVEVIIAYYDSDGKLLFCDMADAEEIGRDENIKYYSFEKYDNATLLKVFAWDGIETAYPYTEPVIIHE